MNCVFYRSRLPGERDERIERRSPHIYANDVVEHEARAVLTHPGEDLPAFAGARMALGQIRPKERYLRVIYVPDPEANRVFVLTAFRLRGKVLDAARARQRAQGRHLRGKKHRARMTTNQPMSGAPTTTEQPFPPGWDEERVLRVIAHHEDQSLDAALVEDEAAVAAEGAQENAPL